MNYFELFEIPVSLRVNKAIIAEKYFALQKKYHPDFYTNAGEEEQQEVLEKSANLNKALKTFRDEDATIKYVLQLKGLLEEEEKYQLPPDFLMDVMELNENLSENSFNEVNAFETGIYKGVQQIIEQYDDATITKAELLKVKDYYFRKKYLHRILERMGE
jgi:molecular chaperone HscB